MAGDLFFLILTNKASSFIDFEVFIKPYLVKEVSGMWALFYGSTLIYFAVKWKMELI